MTILVEIDWGNSLDNFIEISESIYPRWFIHFRWTCIYATPEHTKRVLCFCVLKWIHELHGIALQHPSSSEFLNESYRCVICNGQRIFIAYIQWIHIAKSSYQHDYLNTWQFTNELKVAIKRAFCMHKYLCESASEHVHIMVMTRLPIIDPGN